MSGIDVKIVMEKADSNFIITVTPVGSMPPLQSTPYDNDDPGPFFKAYSGISDNEIAHEELLMKYEAAAGDPLDLYEGFI